MRKRRTKIPVLKMVRAYELKAITDMNWYEIARVVRVNGDLLREEVKKAEEFGLFL